ncbi:hypothetical protein J3E72DRAFT_380109 [Bipolaris maydis]|nr:hypothetical protein J3E74DRAFT_295905 [Bipolaris maydis]KAJ5052670.1 hypothetical protein J3E74DRAFT_295747 [Bipolaris maydis]KAJ6192339.1 hypothetical protein J3E72DRAFT_380109 [Bipolaris maydis]
MVGISEEYGGPGMENFDVYRNLGLSPYEIRINNVDHLKWAAKKAGFLVHHDRLMRHHANKPQDVDLGTLNGLVSYISELETQEQHLAIEELNNRARADWRSTWSVKDKIGDWRPHKPHIDASAMVPPMNDSTEDSRPRKQSPCSPERHHQKNTHSHPVSSHFAHSGSKEDPILVSSDIEDGYANPRSMPSLPAGPRYQLDRFQDHLKSTGSRATFEYKLELENLLELGRQVQRLKTNQYSSDPNVAIGVVRRVGNSDHNVIPEYLVTARLPSYPNKNVESLMVRVWSLDICMKKLPPWGERNQSVIDREDFSSLGYQFYPFNLWSDNQLIQYLQDVRAQRNSGSC